MSLIRHLRRVAWYTLITSKLPQVGATCTRWLPDAGRPDKETNRHEFSSPLVKTRHGIAC